MDTAAKTVSPAAVPPQATPKYQNTTQYNEINICPMVINV
jgi:hypothetical protein